MKHGGGAGAHRRICHQAGRCEKQQSTSRWPTQTRAPARTTRSSLRPATMMPSKTMRSLKCFFALSESRSLRALAGGERGLYRGQTRSERLSRRALPPEAGLRYFSSVLFHPLIECQLVRMANVDISGLADLILAQPDISTVVKVSTCSACRDTLAAHTTPATDHPRGARCSRAC